MSFSCFCPCGVCVTMCLVARVIHQISTDRPSDCVLGVTSIDGELFVLLKRDDNQVAVYSINDYQLLRHLHLPGLKPSGLNDMTSCVQRKCLFASDSDGKCIHRYDLSRSSDCLLYTSDAADE